MNIATGWFDHPKSHHRGWFRVFRPEGYPLIEMWLGHFWISLDFGGVGRSQ